VDLPESPIHNISDTARWVAVYRARESERPDAVFRDPFAQRLAGERGQQIAASMPFAEKNSWPFVARTWLIDRLISEQVRGGIDRVVNLAAGLDARLNCNSLAARTCSLFPSQLCHSVYKKAWAHDIRDNYGNMKDFRTRLKSGNIQPD
jgi:Leucine carboxyl methyltransferase